MKETATSDCSGRVPEYPMDCCPKTLCGLYATLVECIGFRDYPGIMGQKMTRGSSEKLSEYDGCGSFGKAGLLYFCFRVPVPVRVPRQVAPTLLILHMV